MKAVILLSGGIDSAVLLAAMKPRHDCTALSFDYGQPHRKELDSAVSIAAHYGTPHETIQLPALHGAAIANPDAVVPARNLVMLSTAVAIAENHNATAVMFGANKDDLNGFPDCRPQFIEALDEAVYQSAGVCKSILAPLVEYTKAEVIQLGRQLNAPLHLTWSCYRGGDEPCGNCGACELREKASA